MKAICVFIFFGTIVNQAIGQQQAASTGYQQAVPPPRYCRCDELEKCYAEQSTQQEDLSSRCRRECAATLLPNETSNQVTRCYEAYENGKRDQKTNKYQCVQNLISRPCLTDQQQQAPPTQTTLTVDPTKIVQPRVKRNYKLGYPTQLNLYQACVKTCRKNRGVVQFNLDGTPVKPTTKPAGNLQQPVVPANTAQKPGKGFVACAAQLGCQLVPVDKSLEKQAKQICKYQSTQVEDQEFKLCTCLEGALNQNLQCTPTPAQDTCSSSGSQSGEKSACDGTAPK